MAALQVKEDAVAGRVVMQMPILPRLGSLVFGLVWFGFILVFFLPGFLAGSADWSTLLFVLLFAALPIGSSFLAALVTSDVILDKNSRMLTSNRRLLMLPISSTNLSFGDVANIELHSYRQSSGRQSHQAWRIEAVSRDGRRMNLNWNGRQDEMTTLAQKLSGWVGAPVAEGTDKLPVAIEQVLKKLAPAQMEQYEQAMTDQPSPETAEPATPESIQPPVISPMPANELSQMSEVPLPSEMPAADAALAPAMDLSALSIGELEARVNGDSMDSDARYALARKYFARGQADRAIALYQETLRLDPTNVGAQNDLGVALQSRGKHTEAEAAYRRTIALDPFSSIAHLNLGLLLSGKKRAAEASQEFYQARQNARGDDETRAAEAASTGAKMEPRLSNS